MDPSCCSRVSRRYASIAAFLLLSFGAVGWAQVPGPNVNMISVDKYLQKQNEIDLSVSPRNPCHIVGAANDYRTVNNKDLNTDGEIGDSWVGVYVSADCGNTWLNYTMPGYGTYTTAADPIARFGPGGGLYISHIQFNKGTNVGKVAVARYLDFNDFEGVLPGLVVEDTSDPKASPVGYLGTTDIAKGTAGKFLDKPSIAVSPGAGPACSVLMPDKATTVSIPATTVYVAWTEFLSNSDIVLRTKVYFARSTDCGQTLAGPVTKLSEGYPVNQGTVIAVHPTNPNIIYVAWRQVAVDRIADAILYVKSTDGGQTFTKAQPVPFLNGYVPFDQPTTSTTFRTLGYPAMAMDEFGRLYLAVSARAGAQVSGPPPADPRTGASVNALEGRIILTSTTDGITWTEPAYVDPPLLNGAPVADTVPRGHQFMPTMTYAGGLLNLSWYDLRYDVFGKFNAWADEKDVDYEHDANAVRHTLDVRGAQLKLPTTWPPTFNVYGVSEITGDELTKKISLYLTQKKGTERQLNFNRPNLKLYSGGTKPFMGDYIGTAAVQYLPDIGGTWSFNTAARAGTNTVLQTFQTAWTDNRDAIVGHALAPPPVAPRNPDLPYVKPGSEAAAECAGNPDSPGSAANQMTTRNANIYTSRITPGLYLSAPGNSKASNSIERAYGIQVDNATPDPMTVRLTIEAPGISASFVKPSGGVSLVTQKDVELPALSSAAYTVFVAKTAQAYPRIEVTAQQMYGNPNLRASIVLNGDPTNPELRDPRPGDNVKGTDIHTPRVENPRVENKTQESSPVKNPRVENSNPENPRVENPRVENPRVENTSPENPRVENPRVENPRVENSSYSDVTFEVTNDGNTTSAFDVDFRTAVDTTGYNFQLIGWRSYQVPVAKSDCTVGVTEDQQVLFNLKLEAGDFGADGLLPAKKPSMLVRPGETVYWTLRAINDDSNTPVETTFCEVHDCLQTVTTVIAAQAPNTNESAPRVAVSGPGPAIQPPTLPLPVAVVGEPYGPLTFEAVGGTATYEWNAIGGPDGISLSPTTGILSGTPTEVGSYTIQITLTDLGTGMGVTQSFNLSVQAAAPGDILVATDGWPTTPGGVAGRIVRVRRDGTQSSVFAELLSHPLDIAVRPSGGYLVVQRDRRTLNDPQPPVTANEITLVTSDGASASTLISFDQCVEGPGWGCPTGAVAVAADANGNIYVGDNALDRIFRFAPVQGGGWTQTSFNLPSPPNPMVAQVLELDFDGQGRLVVAWDGADPETIQGSRILRITDWATGAYEWVATPAGPLPNPVALSGLDFDSAGNLIVGDYRSEPPRIIRIDGAGTSSSVVAADAAWSGNITGLVVDPYDGTYLFTINGVMDGNPRLVRYPGGTVVSAPELSTAASLVLVPARPAPPSNLIIDVR